MSTVDSWDADTDATRELRRSMVDRLIATGELVAPAWQRCFAAVPRHAFVPVYYRSHDYSRVDGTADPGRDDWLAGVYSDETLITQVTPHTVTSSGTMPSLLATMLQALDVRDGQRVLQIGTGTGYTAALLCARLGSEHVITVDIDAELVATARQRLAHVGHHPTCVAANGAAGHPAGAPYHRIIATCALPAIPRAWLAQSCQGGRIVTPLATGLAALDVHDDQHATGRFLSTAGYFMPMRTSGTTTEAGVDSAEEVDHRPSRVVRFSPAETVFHQHVRFVLAIAVPEIRFGQHSPRLTDVLARDGRGSWARVETTDDDIHHVTEGGPRWLWTEIEDLAAQWQAWNQPTRERFGLTVDADGQRVWLDHPDGPLQWPLPEPLGNTSS